jgi:ankyrin repeat protein
MSGEGKKLHERFWKLVADGKLADLTKFLVANHENPDLKVNAQVLDEDGANILIYCVKEGCDRGPASGRDHVGCSELLVKYGVTLDHPDKTGRTALNWAVLNRNVPLVNKLTEMGADPQICDQDGKSPFHIAVHLGAKDCVNILAKDRPKEVRIVN